MNRSHAVMFALSAACFGMILISGAGGQQAGRNDLMSEIEALKSGYKEVVDKLADLDERKTPVGSIMMLGSDKSAAMPGWIPCDGAELSKDAFPKLFAVIGVQFGGDESTGKFRVPDLRGRSPLGNGTGTELSQRAIGQTGGAERVSLSLAEMPSHSHEINDPGHTHGNQDGGDHPTEFYVPSGLHKSGFVGDGNIGVSPAPMAPAKANITLGNSGEGKSHENMPPFLV